MTFDLFISHAHDDKPDVVRPLATKLKQKGMNLWYDEFSLKIGDSLRESIDHGLANSRYGVVVLSPNFFQKRWPQNELDGLFAMETGNRMRILPVWHNVTADDVRKYSSTLAGRVGIPWESGLDNVVAKIIEKAFVYPVNDHHGRTHLIDLSHCNVVGTPIVPSWFHHEPKRISSDWLEKKLKENAELRTYYAPTLFCGTWLVVDVPNEEGEVINRDQLRDLMPTTATTTTTTTTPGE
jgi:hypothetical protein